MTAKGYWIVNMQIHDPELYQRYVDFVVPFLDDRGARFLVRFGEAHVKEGQFLDRHIIVEFPSFRDAIDAYQSDAYQKGTQDRFASSVANLAIVEGAELP